MYFNVMKILNIKYKLTVGNFYRSSSYYIRVLKRDSLIFFSNSLKNHYGIDEYSRAFMLSYTIYQVKNKKILNSIIASNFKIIFEFFFVLLIPFLRNNLIKNCKLISQMNIYFLKFPVFLLEPISLCRSFNITQEFINNCVEKLKNIKLNKKNKKYIELTKIFLTDPNFLVLAYLQIKSKLSNSIVSVDNFFLDKVNKIWFINAASKIKNNSYKFKSVKLQKISKSNNKKFSLLIICNPKDKIVQKALSLIINQIYEYEDKVFLNTSHGFRLNYSHHSVVKQIKTT